MPHSRRDDSPAESSRPAPSPERERESLSRSYARYAGLGVQFAGTLLVLGALGYWVDHKLGSSPWLMILGIFLGAAGGFVSLVRQVPAVRPPRSKRSEPR